MSTANNPSIFTVITSKVNFAQNTANTGAGGVSDVTGLVLGAGQTVQSGVEFATLALKTVPRAVPLTGAALSAASALYALEKLNNARLAGKPYAVDDIAALVGGVAGSVGGAAAAAILMLTPAGWVAVGLAAVAVTGGVVSTGAGAYQLYAKSSGWTIDLKTGQAIEVKLTEEQRILVDKHVQDTMPMWNKSSVLSGLGIDLGLPAGSQLQVQGSLFCGPDWQAPDFAAPTGLDTAARNSTALINKINSFTTQFNNGGGVDDLWVVEKNAGRYVGSLTQFRADFLVGNSQVDPATLRVQTGQTYFVPLRTASGDTTYHYSSGAVTTTNSTTGTYRVVMPNTDGMGGQTLYSRTADEVGYSVKQVTTNAAGVVVYEHHSYQNTLDAELIPVKTLSINNGQTSVRNWFGVDGYQTDTYSNGSNQLSSSSLGVGTQTYNLLDLSQRADAEYQLRALFSAGSLSQADWYTFTTNTSKQFLGVDLNSTSGSGYGVPAPISFLDPIGAFYDSQSTVYDTAASIANKTTRAMNASGQALSAAQLTALDSNADGQLSTAEAASVRLWADMNEDGRLDAGELLGVTAALKNTDFTFYTRGNGRVVAGAAGAPIAPTYTAPTSRPQVVTGIAPANPGGVALAAPSVGPSVGTPALPAAPAGFTYGLPAAPAYGGVPASNFRQLRDTDNRYWVDSAHWIDFSPGQIKINNSTRNTLIGTDGADGFRADYFSEWRLAA